MEQQNHNTFHEFMINHTHNNNNNTFFYQVVTNLTTTIEMESNHIGPSSSSPYPYPSSSTIQPSLSSSSADPVFDNFIDLPTSSSSSAIETPNNNYTSWTPSSPILAALLEEFTQSDTANLNDSYEDTNFTVANETSTNITFTANVVGSIGWTDIALAALFCCIIAGTVVGNTLVIAAVATTRRLRTVTNCFVMSLAVADWLVGMFVMPPKVLLHLEDNVWRFGKIYCELWISLDILLCTASILSLCAISIDRYLAITRPLAYSRKRRSKRLALSMISCVWVAAVVITSPPMLGWYDDKREENLRCEYNTLKAYVIYSALGSFFLPLLVMLYVYARIACVIATRQKTIEKLHNSADKKCFDSEEVAVSAVGGGGGLGVGGGAGGVGSSSGGCGIEDSRHFSSGSNVINKHSSSNLSSASSSLTNICFCCFRLKRLSMKNAKKQRTKQKRGSNISDAVEPLQTEVPNPNTILSMSGNCNNTRLNDSNFMNNANNGGNPLALTTSTNGIDKSSGNKDGSSTSLSTVNLTRLRTGSRLCHHSLASLSPQKNIVGRRNIQKSSCTSPSTAVGSASTYPTSERNGTTPKKNNSRKQSRKNISNNNVPPKIWTIEDEVDVDGRNSANSALLTSKRSDSSGSGEGGGPADDYNSDDEHYASLNSNRNNYLPSSRQQHSTNKNLNNANLFNNSTNNRNNHNNCQSNSIPSIIGPIGGGGSKSASATPNRQQRGNPSGTATGATRARSVKLNLNIHDQNQNNSREFTSGRIASFKRETKTAQTLAAVVGGFIICWLPFFTVYVLVPFVPDDTFPEALMEFFVWLGWANSVINPFIYAFYSADFRSAFWRLTFRKCEGILRVARSPDRHSPKRYDDPQPHVHLRAACPPQ